MLFYCVASTSHSDVPILLTTLQATASVYIEEAYSIHEMVTYSTISYLNVLFHIIGNPYNYAALPQETHMENHQVMIKVPKKNRKHVFRTLLL